MATSPRTTELLISGTRLANKLFAAGVPLIDQGRIVNNTRVFVFSPKPGQQALIKGILRGR